jgi:hypothetical protein
MIDDREILARSPCCMPLSNRMMATFDEGYRRVKQEKESNKYQALTTSTFTFTLRTVSQGVRMLQAQQSVASTHKLRNDSLFYKIVMHRQSQNSCLCRMVEDTEFHVRVLTS